MFSIERSIEAGFRLRVFFTRKVFSPGNQLLRELMLNDEKPRERRALVVVDESLAQARPGLCGEIEAWFGATAKDLKLVCAPLVIEGRRADEEFAVARFGHPVAHRAASH